VSGVVRAPTNTVWLLGRTLVQGQSDVPKAAAVARQLVLIPLSEYGEYLRTGTYTPPVGVPVEPLNADFDSQPLLSSPGFSAAAFFDFLLPYVLQNPAPAAQLPTAGGLVLDGFLQQGQMTATVETQALALSAAAALAAATPENGWSANLQTGNYDSNYALRTGTALAGFGANSPQDAVYLNAVHDDNDNPLSGAHSYVIHFAAGLTPPANGFWSITAYNQQGFLVANSIGRYSVGSQSGLVANADGSVDLLLQTAQPAAQLSNWLPVPPGSFNLTLRVYWPDQSVLTGAWQPPTITVTSVSGAP
jgi:hypothetical protein